ncbi:hypothetical protein [Bacillus sp. UNC438CL73TsuS30]|uniref:hypothetical protein n=1 Tax=Bacillus sp. UNC438CL73TsuS30 TaxID=1340434 RepID=UPI00047C4E0C|nr:hypothetical protein [Bacillus sp. UNC438CL73TsuS30]
MVKTTLVERDFVDGEILLRELDLAHMKVHSAMWLYDSEVDYWKFIIASEIRDAEGPKAAYTFVWNVLKQMENAGVSVGFSLENILVVSPNDSLIKNLGTVQKTGPNDISGIRFSRNRAGNIFIDDAYIYRIQ